MQSIDYLETYSANPGDIYSNSAIDPAMHNVPRLDLTRCAP